MCPDTPAGDIVDENGCTIGSDNQNNGNQSGDGTSDLSKCEEWELLNPDAIDTSQPGNGCPHYEGETDEKDTTSDSSENKILGMAPVTLGALVAGLISCYCGCNSLSEEVVMMMEIGMNKRRQCLMNHTKQFLP